MGASVLVSCKCCASESGGPACCAEHEVDATGPSKLPDQGNVDFNPPGEVSAVGFHAELDGHEEPRFDSESNAEALCHSARSLGEVPSTCGTPPGTAPRDPVFEKLLGEALESNFSYPCRDPDPSPGHIRHSHISHASNISHAMSTISAGGKSMGSASLSVQSVGLSPALLRKFSDAEIHRHQSGKSTISHAVSDAGSCFLDDVRGSRPGTPRPSLKGDSAAELVHMPSSKSTTRSHSLSKSVFSIPESPLFYNATTLPDVDEHKPLEHVPSEES
jgi:hypothetical protein